MTKILHVIQILTLGGGARALVATAKFSARQGDFEHTVVSLLPPEERAARLALEAGLRVIAAPNPQDLAAAIAAADIVQMHWWNVPEMTDFLRTRHGAMRLIGFYHVAGDSLPHIVTPALADFVDVSVPCNPYTYHDSPIFRDMDPERKIKDVRLVYGAADLSRLDGIRSRPHRGFNIGYIGTIDFIKMHPDFVRMSSGIRIPESRFVVCGDGSLDVLRRQAADLGCLDRFDFRGYVEDVRSAIEEFDVYGYPLCPETYAGSELNLQEVMYAGLAPVVFPYGGVKRLIVNDFTGYIVHSAREYQQAVEHLYHHPAERLRMGRNARAYAEQIFGAENAARKINAVYADLLERPKRTREWRGAPPGDGAGIFLDTLGASGDDYRASREASSLKELLAADARVADCTRVAFISGILAYRGKYPSDPFLRYWAGLAFDRLGSHAEAAMEYVEAIKAGFPHWRAHWRLVESARAIGRPDLAQPILVQLQAKRPGYLREIEEARRAEPSDPLPSAPAAVPPAAPATAGPGGAPSDWSPRETRHPVEEEVLRAEAAFAEGRGEEARRIFEGFLSRHPGHARALNGLGVVQHAAGRKDSARNSFLAAVKADPGASDAVGNLSDSLRELGLHQEALGLCYRFLDERPDDDVILAAAAAAEEDLADRLLSRSLVRDLNYRKRPYRVTAIVSTYKSEAFMRECLEDLEGQSLASELEIVVVDADSPQGENAVVEEFQRRHDNIRYIRTPERIGIYPAWNLAIRAASGDFITPFSTNDRLNPEAYSILRQALIDNPDAALVYGDTHLTNLPHQAWGRHVPTPDYGGVFQWPAYSFEDLMSNCRVGPHPMWRREVHSRVGYFDGRYKAIGDQDFWLRIGIKQPLLHIPVFTGIAWITKESLSGESSSMNEILAIQRKHTLAYIERLRRGAAPAPAPAAPAPGREGAARLA